MPIDSFSLNRHPSYQASEVFNDILRTDIALATSFESTSYDLGVQVDFGFRLDSFLLGFGGALAGSTDSHDVAPASIGAQARHLKKATGASESTYLKAACYVVFKAPIQVSSDVSIAPTVRLGAEYQARVFKLENADLGDLTYPAEDTWAGQAIASVQFRFGNKYAGFFEPAFKMTFTPDTIGYSGAFYLGVSL